MIRVRRHFRRNRKGKRTMIREYLKGGLADGIPDKSFVKKQLKRGTTVEMEHTRNWRIAREIARDHLTENPSYYKLLAKMER